MESRTETHIVGIKARGGTELRRHIEGKRLTQRQAILAKCYDCMGGYVDGKYSCEIPECSLFTLMPYKDIIRPKNEPDDSQA